MRTLRALTASLAVAYALCSGAVVARARTLDRRGAVRAALAQNPQIAAARAEEAAVQAQRRQVTAAARPLISLDAGVGPSMVATLVPGSSALSTQDQYRNLRWSDLSSVWLGDLTVVQPLYTFGKIALRGQAAEHGLKARQAQTRMEKADVAFEVARMYEGYLFARDAERFFQEIEHWLDSTLQGTEDKLAQAVPSVSERDVLRLQAAQGLLAMGLSEARAGRAQARAGLAAFLGFSPDEPLEVIEEELRPAGELPVNFADLVSTAEQRRPELFALREGESALAYLGRAEAAGSWPDLFLLGFVSAAYTPGRDWIQSRFIVDPLNHFVPGAVVGLRWQLQAGMAGARAAEQEAHARALAHLGEWAGAGIPAEVRKAYEDVARGDKDLASGGVAVRKAKQWMVETSADYDVGMADIREVSDAVDAYVTLRTALMRSCFERNVAMAALSKAMGTLDTEEESLYLAPAPAALERP